MPRFVCITGMHRSGTSLATRSLQLLGASLGSDDLLLHAGKDNPAGYWENRLIKELDDDLLSELGGSWDQPPILEPGWHSDPALEPWREQAREALARSFGRWEEHDGVLAWKDPRCSLLLPFWQTVVPVAATLLVVRHPHEVARSLERRNGFAPSTAAALWLRYVLAGAELEPAPRVIPSHQFYDDGTRDLALRAMADHAGLPHPSDRTRLAVAAELDPSLRHHRADHDDGQTSDPIMTVAELVWNDGDLRVDVLPDAVREGFSRGWLRPPADSEALADARAKVVKLQETLRRRAREQAAAKARREAKAAARRAERARRTGGRGGPAAGAP